MQKIIALFGLLITTVFLPAVGMSQEAIRWEPTLESAQRFAGQTNRLVLIQFWAPWCSVCKRMEAEVLTQPSLAGVVAANYVAVKINADYFPATAQQYGVTALPTTVITTPQGKLLDMIKGRIEVAALTARLNQVAAMAKQSGSAPYAQIPGTTAPQAVTSNPTPTAVNRPIVGAQNLPPVGGTQPSNTPGQPVGSVGQSPATASGIPTNNAMADNRYGNYFRRQAEPVTPIAQPQSASAPPTSYPTSGPMPATNTASSPSSTAMTTPSSGSVSGPPLTQPAIPAPAWAQQSSHTPPNSANMPSPAGNGAATLPVLNPPLGLDGFCPVTLAEKQQWVAGDRRWGAIHRGRTYLFSSPDAQRTFFKDPDRYAPAVSGNDVVLAAEQGKAVPGMREHGVFFGPRIYLFSSEATLEKFSRNPNLYANQTLGSLRTGAYAGQPLQ